MFTYLNEKEKLRIIKYNKSFQKKLDISLINYKFFGEKYIIYESKGKGKQYNRNDNALIFEGEFKNGERNGKGEEYDNDGFLLFKGEYKNGNRNGKGREYIDNILIYEGEYLNDQRNGKGKEYDYDGNITFEGTYLNGIKNFK